MIGGRRSYSARVFSPIVSLSEPDALSLHQYFDRWRGAAGYLQPERRLMFAVLLDAVECFQKYPFARGNKLNCQVKDTLDWIFKDNHEWPFSFINICEAVGMDAIFAERFVALETESDPGAISTAAECPQSTKEHLSSRSRSVYFRYDLFMREDR